MMLMQCFCASFFVLFFSDFLYKSIICGYKEVNKKYNSCNLKTMELLDCALIGVCAVIRSNTVHVHAYRSSKDMSLQKF